MTLPRIQRNLLLVALLLAGFALWSSQAVRPFVAHFDVSATYWSAYADNVIRYGIFDVRFGDAVNIVPTTPDQLELLQHHHPFLLTYALIPGRALLGRTELGTRINILFIMLIAAALFYRLARRWMPPLLGRQAGWGALLALFFFVFIPQVLYYSTIPTQELLTLTLILAGLWLYSLWLEAVAAGESGARWRYGLWALAIVGGWADWVYYFFVAYMILHAIWLVGWRRSLALWPQVLVLGVMGGLFVLVNTWQIGWDGFWQNFLGAIGMRLGSTAAARTGYPGLAGLLAETVKRLLVYFTPILALFGSAGLLLLWRERRAQRQTDRPLTERIAGAQAWLPLLPVATTLTFLLVVHREAHWIHDFLLLHLSIPLAFYTAYAYLKVPQRQRRLRRSDRLAWGVILAVFVLTALWGFSVYLNQDRFAERQTWGLAIRDYIEPGDRLLGNATLSQPHYLIPNEIIVNYYAGTDRVLQGWSVPAEDIISGRDQADFYVYCPPTDETGTPLVEGLPDALAALAVTQFEMDGCWFLDLKA